MVKGVWQLLQLFTVFNPTFPGISKPIYSPQVTKQARIAKSGSQVLIAFTLTKDHKFCQHPLVSVTKTFANLLLHWLLKHL